MSLLRASLIRSSCLLSATATSNSTSRQLTSISHSFAINPLFKSSSEANDVSRYNRINSCLLSNQVLSGGRRSISVTPDNALKYMDKDKHSHTKEWMWERA